jgi:hypothetical protein
MAGSFFTRRFAYSGSSCTLEQPGSQWDEIISELGGSNLIDKRHGSRKLLQTIWPSNHTSLTKVYFNEFVANVLHDNIWT